MLITLTEAQIGDHFWVKHIEVAKPKYQKLAHLGIETSKTIVLNHKINAGDMTVVQTKEKSVALQKEETDQIYGEVIS